MCTESVECALPMGYGIPERRIPANYQTLDTLVNPKRGDRSSDLHTGSRPDYHCASLDLSKSVNTRFTKITQHTNSPVKNVGIIFLTYSGAQAEEAGWGRVE